MVGVTINFGPHPDPLLGRAIVHGLLQVTEEATCETEHTLSRRSGCWAAQVLTYHEGQVWEAVLIAGPPVQRLVPYGRCLDEGTRRRGGQELVDLGLDWGGRR